MIHKGIEVNWNFLAAVLGVALLLVILRAQADVNSPVGHWKTFDDKTGQAQGIIEIRKVNGNLQGWITAILAPPQDSRPQLCERCKGELKNAPIVGLRFMWGLKKEGHIWTGGSVLDPESGSVYSVRMDLQDGGDKLQVRGYIGIPLLGRTQIWERIE